jgi:hypothetical protein
MSFTPIFNVKQQNVRGYKNMIAISFNYFNNTHFPLTTKHVHKLQKTQETYDQFLMKFNYHVGFVFILYNNDKFEMNHQFIEDNYQDMVVAIEGLHVLTSIGPIIELFKFHYIKTEENNITIYTTALKYSQKIAEFSNDIFGIRLYSILSQELCNIAVKWGFREGFLTINTQGNVLLFDESIVMIWYDPNKKSIKSVVPSVNINDQIKVHEATTYINIFEILRINNPKGINDINIIQKSWNIYRNAFMFYYENLSKVDNNKNLKLYSEYKNFEKMTMPEQFTVNYKNNMDGRNFSKYSIISSNPPNPPNWANRKSIPKNNPDIFENKQSQQIGKNSTYSDIEFLDNFDKLLDFHITTTNIVEYKCEELSVELIDKLNKLTYNCSTYEFNNCNGIIIAMLDNHDIIQSYCMIRKHQEAISIWNVCTHTDYRGNGNATKIIEYLKLKYNKLWLTVLPNDKEYKKILNLYINKLNFRSPLLVDKDLDNKAINKGLRLIWQKNNDTSDNNSLYNKLVYNESLLIIQNFLGNN